MKDGDKSGGLWATKGIPHKGWKYLHMEVLEAGETETCQMCERAQVRYVHIVHHPKLSRTARLLIGDKPLRVGCICHGNMTGDRDEAEAREREARNQAAKRARRGAKIIDQIERRCEAKRKRREQETAEAREHAERRAIIEPRLRKKARLEFCDPSKWPTDHSGRWRGVARNRFYRDIQYRIRPTKSGWSVSIRRGEEWSAGAQSCASFEDAAAWAFRHWTRTPAYERYVARGMNP